jgi:glycosyltransferase involved in cell wall biosynthesis
VLQQAPEPDTMQIVVVDDASTDIDVEALVKRVGCGRIGYVRQAENVGSLRNFHTCLTASVGEYIHLLHADDLVLPGFYTAMERVLANHPAAGACFARYQYINGAGKVLFSAEPEAPSEGILSPWLERIATANTIQYCAVAVRRKVYEDLGSYFGVTYGEDWEMWVRIASKYPVAYIPESLAQYRMHETSISGVKLQSGQNIRDLVWVMKTIQSHLPSELRKRVWKASTSFCAHDAFSYANRFWRQQGNKKAARRQLAEALRVHVDAALCWKIIKLYKDMTFNIR